MTPAPGPWRVSVLGGLGLMAEAALHDLAKDPRVGRIDAVDISTARAPQVLSRIRNRKKIKVQKLDLNDKTATLRALKGSQCVLNCSWYEFNLQGMGLALGLKAHYVDLGGLYRMTLRQLRLGREFEKAGLLGLLGCGSTPGITNMMTARMAEGFESVRSVMIYDACHDPSLEAEPFVPPFSIRTMLAEYVQPALLLKNGRIVEVPPHSQGELMDFPEPIGRVSLGAVIHSEAATLPAFLKDKGLRDLAFKIYYPEAVRRHLRSLVELGLSKDRDVRVNGGSVTAKDFLSALARQNAVQAAGTPADFEVLRVRVAGRRGGSPLAKTWDCVMRPQPPLSAGALGVGYTGSIASLLALAGSTQSPGGVGGPEGMLDSDAFFRELRRRGAFRLTETVERALSL